MIDEKLKKLEELSTKLDSDSITLDEGVKIFEEGTKLAKECYKELTDVKGKIYVLKQDVDKMREELFD